MNPSQSRSFLVLDFRVADPRWSIDVRPNIVGPVRRLGLGTNQVVTWGERSRWSICRRPNIVGPVRRLGLGTNQVVASAMSSHPLAGYAQTVSSAVQMTLRLALR